MRISITLTMDRWIIVQRHSDNSQVGPGQLRDQNHVLFLYGTV
jgi:hypothetical protein